MDRNQSDRQTGSSFCPCVQVKSSKTFDVMFVVKNASTVRVYTAGIIRDPDGG
jgi:hypothetical protein